MGLQFEGVARTLDEFKKSLDALALVLTKAQGASGGRLLMITYIACGVGVFGLFASIAGVAAMYWALSHH